MHGPADDPAWDRAVTSAYGLRRIELEEPNCSLRLFRADGGRAITNSPYLEYGGIRVAHATLSAGICARLGAVRDNESARYVLLKSREPLAAAGIACHVDENYVTFELDLQAGARALWTDALSAKTRNQVRKAERNNFRAAFGGIELLSDFYAVISRCWRDLGTPTHSRALFAAISSQFGERCRFHVLYADATPVAGALLLEIGGMLHHPFAGTINRFKPTSANNLLYWGIINDACERGLQRFDMGRSARDSGTFNYKRSWGASAQPLYYHYFLADGQTQPSLTSQSLDFATRAWRRVPLGMANALGPYLIRYML